MAVGQLIGNAATWLGNTLVRAPLNYLGAGLQNVGLNSIGNAVTSLGGNLGQGIAELGMGNIGNSLKSLYTGADVALGGLLPGAQNVGSGYLASLYTSADKALGGKLPNFANGFGYSAPAATNSALASGAAGDGFLGSQDVYGKTFTDARLLDGTPIKFTPAGNLVTSLAPGASGLSGFMDKAMAGAKLAGAVGAVASLLNGGGSGGSNPTAGRTPASSRMGGALSASRAMSQPQSNSAPAGGGYYAGTGASGGISMGMTEAEKIEAVNDLIDRGYTLDQARAMVDPTAQAVMPGTGGAVDASSIDLFKAAQGSSEQLLNDLSNELNSLSETVNETADAVDAQEQAESGDTKEELIDALVGEGNIPVPLGGGKYSFNPVTF